MELINSASEATVSTWMPKFKYECTVPMNDVLRSLGVTDAFSEDAADLHRLGHSDLGNLYIDEVFHYTFISVDSQGTKAGAATAIKMNGKSSGDAGKYSVNLNRPFVYAIIDTSTELPIFIGTIMDFDSIQE